MNEINENQQEGNADEPIEETPVAEGGRHPDTCKDLNCFNSTYQEWFNELQAHHWDPLDSNEERWIKAYEAGTIPCTALSDLGITPRP